MLEPVKSQLVELFGFELVVADKQDVQEDVQQTQCSQVSLLSTKYYFLRNTMHVPPLERARVDGNADAEDGGGGEGDESRVCAARNNLIKLCTSRVVPWGVCLVSFQKCDCLLPMKTSTIFGLVARNVPEIVDVEECRTKVSTMEEK